MSLPVTKKVNNVKIRLVPDEKAEYTRPIKGYDVCQHLYGNIFLCAKKNSGKTTVIWNFIDRCAGRDTVIIAFVSTLNNDPNWRAMQKKCEEKGLPVIGYTSLKEDGVDQLDALIKSLQDKAGDEKAEAAPPTPTTALPHMGLPGTETKETKKKRTPYRAPDYIIILDDLADELRNKSVATLLKKNRHFKCKVIVSSQWLNDLAPESLRQMSVVCMFRGFSLDKLEEFHAKANLGLPLDNFVALYQDATKEKFSFLYIDMDHGKYRKKFNLEYQVNDVDDE